MNLPQRTAPGPRKRFKRYLTVPITDKNHEDLEKLKWRTRIDKTEVVRRLVEYFNALPEDSQDKILKSFDSMREGEMKTLRKRRDKPKVTKEDIPTYKKEDVTVPANAYPTVTPNPVRRSGLP